MNNLLRHSKLFVKRNASTILTCLGGAGVVATAVMAVKATPKAMRAIDIAQDEKGEELTKLEVIKVAGPAYIPSILTGTTTLACIFGANILNKREQAALMSAYAFLDNSYKEYKKKVEELYGEDGVSHIREELAKDKYEDADISVEDELELFYDEFSERYFQSTKYKVQRAMYEINRTIQMGGGVTLNDFYEHLGVDPVEYGELLGWSEGGNNEKYWQSWIDFTYHDVVMDDGLECTIVSMFMEPYPSFQNY